MSTYNELIKNFKRIRSYMRDFYIYGFKSRDDFHSKSARSYDDERRCMESWLRDHMSFVRIPEILSEIDEKCLAGFESPLMFDESTILKKLKEYCEAGIYSTCVVPDTLDESPMAYKSMEEIVENIGSTA